MIRTIQAADAAQYPFLISQMHRLRAEVFADRLGWDVEVRDGWERDRYDDHNPLYLLSTTPGGRVEGCLRLLPTTGPNMLRDTFGALLDGETVRSPLVWESSRFCVVKSALGDRLPSGANRVTAELLQGMCEVGILAGLDAVVTVSDPLVKRIVEKLGARGEVLGTPKRFGKVTAYAGLYETNDEQLARLRERSGLASSVLERAAEERVATAA